MRAVKHDGERWQTYLLHNTSFALGKGDVPARFVADELNLNLPTLAAALLVIVVVVVAAGHGPRALDAATLLGAAIAILRLFEVGWRRLVVLIRDVGHVANTNRLYHTKL